MVSRKWTGDDAWYDKGDDIAGQRRLTGWAHYNKPMHQKIGIDIMTVHFKNECRFVKSIQCDGGFHTHNRKQQPRMIIKGKTRGIIWDGFDEATNTWELAHIQ